MTTRDNRGRFISADEAAATRVLEAGVREAVRLLRGGWGACEPIPGFDVAAYYAPPDRERAEAVLADAGRAADLLLTTNGAGQ